MSKATQHDAWSAGESYDAYMGRWSRKMAVRFLDWLSPADNLDWLDVGCGTGALSSMVLSRCNPRSLVGVEQSAGFVATAKRNVSDGRARFEVGDAQNLPLDDHSRDIVASALVLNFVPDIPKALSEMKRVVRPGGTIAFYVWDYPGGGEWDSCGPFGTPLQHLIPTLLVLPKVNDFHFAHPRGSLNWLRMPACSQ